MSLKSIIIDKQTKAKRLSPDKVRLDIVAMPLDEENNTEPGVAIRIYINDQILENITINSGPNGIIKESLTIDDSDSESILVKLKELKGEVESKLRHVMMEEKEYEEREEPAAMEKTPDSVGQPNKSQGLYNINKDVLKKFKVVDEYFQKLIKPENRHEIDYISSEFNKIQGLAQLKFNLEKAKTLEFYEKYKKEIDDIQNYCFDQMTVYEVDLSSQEIVEIIKTHNDNISSFRKEKEEIKKPKPAVGEPKIEEDAKIAEKEKIRIQEKKQKIIAQLKVNPDLLYNYDLVDQESRDDKEIVKYALKQNGMLLQCAGENVKKDKETVMIAINQNHKAFYFISDFLKTDEDFVLECIKKFGTKIIKRLPIYTMGLSKIKIEIDKANIPIKDLQNKIDLLNKQKNKLYEQLSETEAYKNTSEYPRNSAERQAIVNIDYVEMPKLFQELSNLQNEIRNNG